LTIGVMAVAFARRFTFIVNSPLRISLEGASLESDDNRLPVVRSRVAIA